MVHYYLKDTTKAEVSLEFLQPDGKLIKKYSDGYDNAEQVRTSKWVGKQQARIEKAIAKHCELDAQNLVKTCS